MTGIVLWLPPLQACLPSDDAVDTLAHLSGIPLACLLMAKLLRKESAPVVSGRGGGAGGAPPPSPPPEDGGRVGAGGAMVAVHDLTGGSRSVQWTGEGGGCFRTRSWPFVSAGRCSFRSFRSVSDAFCSAHAPKKQPNTERRGAFPRSCLAETEQSIWCDHERPAMCDHSWTHNSFPAPQTYTPPHSAHLGGNLTLRV